jgi:hypothetical protein
MNVIVRNGRRVLSLLILCVFGILSVSAQAIGVNGGSLTMSIASGTVEGMMLNVVNTTATLVYQKQNSIAKITVRTVCPGQNFNLEVTAINVTAGVAAPSVMLVNGNTAIDLIRDIPKSGKKDATCLLQYTASSTFSQGNSTEENNDVHIITYTIQSQ